MIVLLSGPGAQIAMLLKTHIPCVVPVIFAVVPSISAVSPLGHRVNKYFASTCDKTFLDLCLLFSDTAELVFPDI